MRDVPPDADIEAMRRLAAGDDVALNEIMQRWREKLAAFLTRMTGDHATAIDLAQETFVRLYQHRASYQPSAPFPTYLFRIASNLARNHARWKRRHPTVSMDDLDESRPEPAASSPVPDQQLDHSERLRIIEAAIAALPPDVRETILLFTHHDLSYAQIADVMRCTSKAVETRIYRARQMLKATLREMDS